MGPRLVGVDPDRFRAVMAAPLDARKRLLPIYALAAYIGVIYFSEIFNFSLSCLRLKRVFPAA